MVEYDVSCPTFGPRATRSSFSRMTLSCANLSRACLSDTAGASSLFPGVSGRGNGSYITALGSSSNTSGCTFSFDSNS